MTMVVAALGRTGNAWLAKFMLQPQDSPSWGKIIQPVRECLKLLPGVEVGAIISNPRESVDVPPKIIDCDIEEFANRVYGTREAEDRTLKKIRIDMGWEFMAGLEEPPDMDLNCAFYDAKGTELQVINFGNREGDGAELSGDDTVSDPDKVAAHESDRVGFPVDESIYIDFRKIPKKTKNIVVGVTNYSGGGFAKLKKVFCRLVDITKQKDPAQWRDVYVFHTDVAECQDESLSGLVVFKLSKEAKSSKYWDWAKSAADSKDVLGGLLPQDKPLKEYLATLIEEQNTISGQYLERGEDEEEEEEEGAEPRDDPDAANWNWRLRTQNVFIKGESWEEGAEDVATAATYEGLRDAKGWRCDRAAKSVYPNGDVYYGGYLNDRKSGKGLYVFANKGAYAGAYKNGLRSGYGMMWYPDGSIYEGQWHKDKMWGLGQYDYADGSTYIGKWREGKKHGSGVYWDKVGACLTGTWEKGILQGEGIYDIDAFQLVAKFRKGIPVGDVLYTLQAHRTKDWPKTACKFILADQGPTLTHAGSYGIPPGADADVPEGEDEPADDDGPKMPGPPDYSGLTFLPAHMNPNSAPDIPYPGDKELPPPTFTAPPPPPPAEEEGAEE